MITSVVCEFYRIVVSGGQTSDLYKFAPCFLFSLGKDLVTFCKCSEKIRPFWAIGKISASKRNDNVLLID